MNRHAIVFLADLPKEKQDSRLLLQGLCDELGPAEISQLEPIGVVPEGTPEAFLASSEAKLCCSARVVSPTGLSLLCVACHAPWTAPPGVCTDDLTLEDTPENRDMLAKVAHCLGAMPWAKRVLWFESSQESLLYLSDLLEPD